MSIKLLALGGLAVDIVIGKIIEHGTNGDVAKKTARATEVYALAAGAKDIVDGDPSAGVNTIAGAVLANVAALAPYEQQAVTNLMNLAQQELTVLQGTGAGQIIGLAGQSIGDAILAEVEAVCVKEGATVPPAAAKAAA